MQYLKTFVLLYKKLFIDYRVKLYGLFGIALMTGALELLSIVAIVPIISNALGLNTIDGSFVFSYINLILVSISNYLNISVYIIVGFIFLLKTVFVALGWYYVTKSAFSAKAEAQYQSVLATMVNQDDKDLNKSVLVDAHHLQAGFVSPIISLIMEIVPLLLILTAIFVLIPLKLLVLLFLNSQKH